MDLRTQRKPYGPDLSSHNARPARAQDPNFPSLIAGGAQFVFIKKDQGTDYSFAKYAQECQQAKDAGLLVFDYHYLSYNSLPADQVKCYLEGRRTSAQPCFDFENWSDSGEGPARRPDYMLAWAHDFAIQVHTATGQWPIMYSYVAFLKSFGADLGEFPFEDCPLWLADYRKSAIDANHPEVPAPWQYHTFWQYTSVGTLSGVDGVVDISIFNGTFDNLRKLANA